MRPIAALALILVFPLPAHAADDEEPAPRIGFLSKPISERRAAKLGIEKGAQIRSITQGCPSYDAFRLGDVLVSMGGTPVDEAAAMRALYDDFLEEGAIEVELLRGGERRVETVPLFDCPEHRKAADALAAKLPFASPIQLDGTLAGWGSPSAAKELVGDLASQAGAKAAGMAVDKLASKIPMAGGLVSSAAKQAASAAVDAAVGPRVRSDQRFATACELGKHLQGHASRADFPQVMLAVNTIYADHEQAIAACMTPEPTAEPATPPALPVAAPDLAAQLEKLTTLHAAGALSDDAFAAAKAKLLGL